MSIDDTDVSPSAVFAFHDNQNRVVISTMTGAGLAEMQVHWQFEGQPAGIAEAFGANTMSLSEWRAKAVRLVKPGVSPAGRLS